MLYLDSFNENDFQDDLTTYSHINQFISRFLFSCMIYYYIRAFCQDLEPFEFIKEQFNGSSEVIYSIWTQLNSNYNYY